MNTFGILAWGMSVGIVVIILCFEIFLSKQKNVFWGILPILIIFISVAGAGIYARSIQDNNNEFLEAHNFTNGMIAEVKMLENNGKIISYSNIMIKNKNGALIDEVPFVIENNKVISKYTEIADYYHKKYNLTGASEDIRWINSKTIDAYGVKISATFLFQAAFILNIPLIVIFIILRRSARQQRITKEIKALNVKMKIDNL